MNGDGTLDATARWPWPPDTTATAPMVTSYKGMRLVVIANGQTTAVTPVAILLDSTESAVQNDLREFNEKARDMAAQKRALQALQNDLREFNEKARDMAAQKRALQALQGGRRADGNRRLDGRRGRR